jgi:hypothetical protein
VIGPALVFTGHESPPSEEAQRVRSALLDVGYEIDQDNEITPSVASMES